MMWSERAELCGGGVACSMSRSCLQGRGVAADQPQCPIASRISPLPCSPTYPSTHSYPPTHPEPRQLPTRKEGIFVMPLDRISILSTYT